MCVPDVNLDLLELMPSSFLGVKKLTIFIHLGVVAMNDGFYQAGLISQTMKHPSKTYHQANPSKQAICNQMNLIITICWATIPATR